MLVLRGKVISGERVPTRDKINSAYKYTTSLCQHRCFQLLHCKRLVKIITCEIPSRQSKKSYVDEVDLAIDFHMFVSSWTIS